MSDGIQAFIFAGVVLVFFLIFLSRIQRRSKKIMQESIDVAKERIQTEREGLVVQKETNELLKQIVAKLNKKI